MKRLKYLFAFLMLLALALAPAADALTAGAITSVPPNPTCQGATGICAGQSIQLSANPSGGNPKAYHYVWYQTQASLHNGPIPCSPSFPYQAIPSSDSQTLVVSPPVSTHYCYQVTSGSETALSPMFPYTVTVTGQLGTQVCTPLFAPAPGNGNAALVKFSNYNDLVGLSMIIILLVLAAMGIVYAFGIAFNIESLKNFTRTEALESFFNIIVVVLIAGGIGFTQSASSFITNLGLAAVAPTQSQPVVAPTTTSFQNLCEIYMNNGAGTAISGFFGLLPTFIVSSALQYFEIDAQPNGIGFEFKPYAGLWPMQQVLNQEMDMYLVVAGTLSVVGMALFVIYFVFPIFLYVGILLRSFPWTRAAGGSMLALFICFYVIFPALLYPFSVLAVAPSGALYQPYSIGAVMSQSTSYIQAAIPLASLLGRAEVNQISGFAYEISYALLQMFGVAIAFVICFDLIERLGDLLGAPSLQGKLLFSKVV